MRFFNLTGSTALDLGNPPDPGAGAYAKFVAINLHSSAISIQQSDDDGATDPYTDVSGSEGTGVAVNQAATIQPTKRYLKIEGGAGVAVLLYE